MILIPLILSAFTHLWNPIGFPGVHYDEAIYLERGMRILEALGPQDPVWRYDHPFFGQIFLASIFSIIGYPSSLQPEPGDPHSVEMLYLAPRVLMGMLAIVDTLLIYKIAEKCYDKKVALIASILFAVMPLSWLERRIYLESIQLPLILCSILFALHIKKRVEVKAPAFKSSLNRNNLAAILLSGLFLGAAIFTKIPAFAMIPLVGFLILRNSRNSLKSLGFWFIPVILIPAIWPIYAMSIGELGTWTDEGKGVVWQTQRVTQPLFDSIESVLEIDPVLLVMGSFGVLYVTFSKRDVIPILWTGPLLVFLYLIQFTSYWHVIPLIPILCIASAVLLVDLSRVLGKVRTPQDHITNYFRIETKHDLQKKLERLGDFYLLYKDFKKISQIPRPSSEVVLFMMTAVVAMFGLVSTSLLLQTSVNSSYFNTIAYVAGYLPDKHNGSDDSITVVGSPRYFWIPRYVFDKDYNYKGYTSTSPINTVDNVAIVDRGFRNIMLDNDVMKSIFDNSTRIAEFTERPLTYDTEVYPYSNMKYGSPDPRIEVRITERLPQ
jgi:hypothetical protein